MDRSREYQYFDQLIILGAGPAGLSCFEQAKKLGVRARIIDCENHGISSIDGKSHLQIINGKTGRDQKRDRYGGLARVWGGQLAYPSPEDELNWARLEKIDTMFFDILEKEKDDFLKSHLGRWNKKNNAFSREDIYPGIRLTSTIILKRKNILKLIRVKNNEVKEAVVDARIKSLEISNRLVSAIVFEDNTTLAVDKNTAVIIALGCIESTLLIKKSIMTFQSSNSPIEINVIDGLKDHPHGVVLRFAMPAFARKIPRKSHRGRLKLKYEMVEEQDDLYRSAIFEIRREDEPYSVKQLMTKDEYFSFKDRCKTLLRGVARKMLPYQIHSRLLDLKYNVWIQIEQSLVDSGTTLDLSCINENEKWFLSETDTDFILRMTSKFKEFLISELKLSGKDFYFEIDNSWFQNPENTFDLAYHPHASLGRRSTVATEIGTFGLLGEVRGVDNCRVASSAIFTTMGWFNPTLILILISRLITKDLLARGFFRDFK